MANGKFSNGKRSNLKPVALLLAIALLVGTAVGGTLAWLTDKTNEVKNVFTVGNIDIELNETKDDFKMIPGYTIEKDPKVTVKAGSEKCYVFVDVDESASLNDYITYVMEPGWTLLEKDAEGKDIKDQLIFYRVQEALTDDGAVNAVYSVIGNKGAKGEGTFVADVVLVKDTVKKEMMDSFDANKDGVLSDAEKATLPTLTFTAYAVQFYKSNGVEFGAAAAWAEAK